VFSAHAGGQRGGGAARQPEPEELNFAFMQQSQWEGAVDSGPGTPHPPPSWGGGAPASTLPPAQSAPVWREWEDDPFRLPQQQQQPQYQQNGWQPSTYGSPTNDWQPVYPPGDSLHRMSGVRPPCFNPQSLNSSH